MPGRRYYIRHDTTCPRYYDPKERGRTYPSEQKASFDVDFCGFIPGASYPRGSRPMKGVKQRGCDVRPVPIVMVTKDPYFENMDSATELRKE